MNSAASLSRTSVATATVSTDSEQMFPFNGQRCSECLCSRSRARSWRDDRQAELIEHDLDVLPAGGQLVRLKNGGSAFGSRESLNLIGTYLLENVLSFN